MQKICKLVASQRAEIEVPDPNSYPLQKRLDLVIQLLLEIAPEGGKTTAAKIDRLLELGCTQSETAHILGKDPKDVTSRVSKLKKRGAGKAKPAQEVDSQS